MQQRSVHGRERVAEPFDDLAQHLPYACEYMCVFLCVLDGQGELETRRSLITIASPPCTKPAPPTPAPQPRPAGGCAQRRPGSGP